MDINARVRLKIAEVERLRVLLRLARLELEAEVRAAQQEPVSLLLRVK